MAQDTCDRIDYLWADSFGLAIQEYMETGVRVIRERDERPQRGIRVLAHAERCIISIYPELEGEIRRRTEGLTPADCQSDATMANVFSDLSEEPPIPVFHSFQDGDGFRPFRSPDTRLLAFGDRAALFRFLGECPIEEVSSSSLGPLRQFVYGFTEEDRVLAAAYFGLVAPYAVSIGVLTHPAHRRNGLGKAAASAATEAALHCGFLVLWRTAVENAASAATAKSLGFHEYGRGYDVPYPQDVSEKHGVGDSYDVPYRVHPRLHTIRHCSGGVPASQTD